MGVNEIARILGLHRSTVCYHKQQLGFAIKQRLIAAGVKRNRCEDCGLDRWRGSPLSLSLHHVNGERHDNRLENLRLLCPNCHSQTPNFGSKNKRLAA